MFQSETVSVASIPHVGFRAAPGEPGAITAILQIPNKLHFSS